MDSKEYFLTQIEKYTLAAPDDIRFVLYGKKTWAAFLDAISRRVKDLKVSTSEFSVLDVGCGGGTLLHCLADRGYTRLYGVDFIRGIEPGFLPPEFRFIESDACSIPLPSNSMDCVCSTMTLEHCDDTAFVSEMLRLVKPGGMVLLTTVFKTSRAWYWYKNHSGEAVIEPSHLREYTDPYALETLIAGRAQLLYKELAKITYPIVDPMLKILARVVGKTALNKGAVKKLRLVRIPIPGYYSLEVIAQKHSHLS